MTPNMLRKIIVKERIREKIFNIFLYFYLGWHCYIPLGHKKTENYLNFVSCISSREKIIRNKVVYNQPRLN